MSRGNIPEQAGSGETQNENLTQEDSTNPGAQSKLRENIIQQISEKQREIRHVRHKRNKLSKKHKQTAEMLSLLCSLASDISRGHSPDPGVGMQELEEKHRAVTESALKERQLFLDEYSRQFNQVNRLIGANAEQVEGASNQGAASIEGTPIHENISFVQPTPEREGNLEEYLMKRSQRSPSRARQGLFNGRDVPLSECKAVIEARKQELRVLEAERDDMVRQCNEMTAGTDEGLLGEVRREREKYASLLEERRLLEETQNRISQRMNSPGPPPIPECRVFRSNSDMEVVSIVDNEFMPQTDQWPLPEYYLPQETHPEPSRPHINPTHSLPVVLPHSSGEMWRPHLDRDWQQVAEPIPIQEQPATQPSVLVDISEKLSLLLQQREDAQQQQHLQSTQGPQPIYTPAEVHQGPPLPATTPVQYQPQQFYPNTPGTELPGQLYCTTPHHFYQPHSNSLPPYLSYPPPPPVTPTPLPYYAGYSVQPPYYQPTTPYMYQSLPNPHLLPNQWTQTLHYPPPPAVQAVQHIPRVTPPQVHHPAPSQEISVPLTASCTQTDLTFQENPLSRPLIHECEVMPVLSELDTVTQARRELPKIPPRREDVPLLPYSSSIPLPDTTQHLRSTPQESPLFDQVRERIYSEVASLVSENESRPYYLMELLRAAQLLKTDYLREAGLSSLKRVINNYLNQDQIDAQAFSALPSEENPVHSPTQNFPLARHYLNTDISDSSENVVDRCPSRNCQWTQELQQALNYLHEEAQSDISEITTSDLSSQEFSRVSPWEQQVREVVTRLVPILKDHLDHPCDPKLLALIHQYTLMLLSDLFPGDIVLHVRQGLDAELKEILFKYRSHMLRDRGEELLVDISNLFFSQLDTLVSYNSIDLSNGTDGDSEREGRDQARDDALAAATEEKGDETICLSDSTRSALVVQGHQCVVPLVLSPPNIINLTLSECRPMDDDVTSEKSEDYSQSKTVDTISETASCTASDLSEVNQHRAYNHVQDFAESHTSPKHSEHSTSPLQQDEEDLPPFANVSLAQGSFTVLKQPNETQVQTIDLGDSDNEFVSEVMSLGPANLALTGKSLEILPPSSH